MTAVMKLKFEELKFKLIHYCDCKNFSNNTFREYLLSKLWGSINSSEYSLERFL